MGLNAAVSVRNITSNSGQQLVKLLAPNASLVLCSDSNEYVDEVFDRSVESMHEVSKYH